MSHKSLSPWNRVVSRGRPFRDSASAPGIFNGYILRCSCRA